MSRIELYGHSDDLVELRGDIKEEWGAYGEDRCYIAFSNGVLLSIEYDGEWKIMKHAVPDSADVKVHPVGSIDDQDYNSYTDLAVMETEEEINWVVKGGEVQKPV